MRFHARFQLAAWVALVIAAIPYSLDAQKLLPDGVQDLATQIASKVQQEQKQKIAVLPFRELDGRATVLGTYLSEDLVTHLFNLGNFDIVERTMLDRLLGEIKLGQSGLIDPETAKEVGKIAGVDAVVTGTLTDLQSYVAVNCRLIDTATGRVFAAAQVRIAKDDDVRKILEIPMPEAKTASLGSGGQGTEPPRPRQAQAIQERQEQEFSLALQGCFRSGTSVRCQLMITNHGQDRNFGLSQSRLFDELGNEWSSQGVTLGNKGPVLWVRSLLVKGIPTKAEIRFDGVEPGAEVATLFEVNCSAERNARVQFRNVALTEQ
ncbi:MAG TPA: FlgO family outer membrane protein [Thermoanaerobaculia bacterium]|nr:FlgO family outer membrane protein [Thermoanaerobaculia bacterium]